MPLVEGYERPMFSQGGAVILAHKVTICGIHFANPHLQLISILEIAKNE